MNGGITVARVRVSVSRKEKFPDDPLRFSPLVNHVVVRQSGGMWPASPSARSDTLPRGEMEMSVMEPFFNEMRSQASGGS